MMRYKFISLLMVLLLFVTACGSETVSSTEKIKWLSYDEGIKQGKQEGKKVFISFYADWCTFCEKMEKETFRKNEVVGFVNENFVAIRVNSDKEAEIARKYFVRGLPMTWFMDANGEKISSIPGYIPPDMFMQVLNFVHSDSYKTMTFKEFVDKHDSKS
ncbi:MAG: thioredoxin fold domain-containing protein [Proteobacteria bacterium]|nr:thioredoxin fold domain-containing protein [Pseudomonadota bacterium]MBU4471195.1 thioredoxin fold domain-containing protein [Pseudomonadota bacterium]MCG2753170.1 thioredoxin fold domain-containing protein [Desulfobacteraceae bacterium]